MEKEKKNYIDISRKTWKEVMMILLENDLMNADVGANNLENSANAYLDTRDGALTVDDWYLVASRANWQIIYRLIDKIKEYEPEYEWKDEETDKEFDAAQEWWDNIYGKELET